VYVTLVLQKDGGFLFDNGLAQTAERSNLVKEVMGMDDADNDDDD
jgi:hypothetical protein